MSTKRYSSWCSNTHGHQLMEHPEGAWVRFEDYESLRIVESEFHNIDDVAEIRRLNADIGIKVAARNKWMKECVERGAEINRLREDRAAAIDRLTPLGLENVRLKQRCWALALLLYPSGEAREAIEGDI